MSLFSLLFFKSPLSKPADNILILASLPSSFISDSEKRNLPLNVSHVAPKKVGYGER